MLQQRARTVRSGATTVEWQRSSSAGGWRLQRVEGDRPTVDAFWVGQLLAILDDDAEVRSAPTDGWQDFVQRLAHGVRRAALACPRAVPALVSCGPAAAGTPLGSPLWVDRLTLGLVSAGFGERDAVAAYQSVSTFLVGHLWADHAAVSRRQPPDDSDFEDGLEVLLERLARQRGPVVDLWRPATREAGPATGRGSARPARGRTTLR